METDYQFHTDLLQMEYLLALSKSDFAKQIGATTQSLQVWEKTSEVPSRIYLESFYSFIYKKGLQLNDIKAQFYQDDKNGLKILFHGSKNGLDGPISIAQSKPNKDFGKGFYCGENLSQSISFVASLPTSSIYILSFNESGLVREDFDVDQDWMLAIAYFRGRLEAYKNHPLIKKIAGRIQKADFVVAPIADNRMYQIIDAFIDGEISDEQCKHCLSATNLGKQYVFLTPKALDSLQILEHCYLSSPEKIDSGARRLELVSNGANKVALARIKYKGRGSYIEEILK